MGGPMQRGLEPHRRVTHFHERFDISAGGLASCDPMRATLGQPGGTWSSMPVSDRGQH